MKQNNIILQASKSLQKQSKTNAQTISVTNNQYANKSQKQDSTLTSFITMLKNSGWKEAKSKRGNLILWKYFDNYKIILSSRNFSQLSFQSRSYSSKFTEFVANIICEQTEEINVTLAVLNKATNKTLNQFNFTLPLSTTENELNDTINKYIKNIKNKNTKKGSTKRPKNNVKAEEKNQSKKQLSKDEMIDSILDKLSDEQYDILAKRYKILNMD